MADWDDEEFEPAAAIVGKSDKWAGEDEDDEVKDAWDLSSEEEDSQKSEKKEGEAAAVQRNKKKKIADIIAEKEEARLKKQAEDAFETEKRMIDDTPEAKMAEKLRQQKLAEDEDLELAKEMLGIKDSTTPQEGTIDTMSPVSKEEFEEFQKAISEKIDNFSNSEHYPEFVENLIKSLCMTLNSTTLKKIKTDVDAFHSAKMKEEKAAKGGKKPAKKNVIKMERDNDYGIGAYHDNDMDDFM